MLIQFESKKQLINYIELLKVTNHMKGNRLKQGMTKPKNISAINSNMHDLSVSASFQSRLGVTRAKQPSLTFPQKIKSNASFSVEKNVKPSAIVFSKVTFNTAKKNQKPDRKSDKFKLPQIRKSFLDNPEEVAKLIKQPEDYYQSKVLRALKFRENTYMMNLARQHFLQNIEAIKIGKNMRLNPPKEIKLHKRNPKFKTIFLDLDETLIHCDEASTNYTIKLNFPVQGGGIIAAGIRVRPYCHEFLQQLSAFAEIIIFTASASSYADVVLDYLDPDKKYFAHRLYRQHCTLQKNFYTKDLRIVNRRPEDVAIVDNSGFSFMTQPQFGIPILPFYHFSKDKELQSLLEFLRKLVDVADMRETIRQTFFWDIFKRGDTDPRLLFRQQFQSDIQTIF